MNTATKTRTQRRMEKKQTLILLVLVLAVALASFFLGAVVGRQGAERELAQKLQAAEKILVTPAPKPVTETAPPVVAEQKTTDAEPAAEAEEETELTFYDNLAKEEKIPVPIGSGMNYPDQPKPAVKPPIDLPDQPVVKRDAPAVAVAKVGAPETSAPEAETALIMPKTDSKGTYAVQVGSFAAAGDAGAFKQKLLTKGYPAFVAEADLGAKGLWYRVKIGPYGDAKDAKSVLQLIDNNEQIKGFVSRK